MKKIILIASASLLVIGLGAAGMQTQHHDPIKMAERMTAHMAEALELTEKQEARILEITTAKAQKAMEMRANGATPQEIHEHMFEQMHGTKAAIASILTEEQRAKMEEMMEHHHAVGMHGRIAHHHAMMHGEDVDPAELKSKLMKARQMFDLNLSAEEKAIISEKAEMAQKMKSHIKENQHHRHNFHGHKDVMIEKMAPVIEIAQNHKDELIHIFKEIHGISEEEHQAMQDKMPMNDEEKNQMFNMMAVHFLLNPAGTTAEPKTIEINTFPNPATENVSVTFKVDQPSWVKVQLIDHAGRAIEMIQDGELEIGEYTFETPIPSEVNDFGIIEVTVGDIVSTEKVIIQK